MSKKAGMAWRESGSVPPESLEDVAHAEFEATPAALDLQQRARTGLDLVASTLRSAGSHVGATDDVAPLAAAMPAVGPLRALDGATGEGPFSAIDSVSLVSGGSQGVLDRDQGWPQGPLTLTAGRSCPLVGDVCGFRAGTVAAIVDGHGRFDVFVVAATDAANMRLVPSVALSARYPAGAAVVEVDASRFGLALQPDGSRSLVRKTAGGATQPVVDGVSRLVFEPWGEAAAPTLYGDAAAGWATYGPGPPPITWTDPEGGWPPGASCVIAAAEDGPRSRFNTYGEAGTLVGFDPTLLEDGPWCPGGPDGGRYDADRFRLRRIDISLRVEAMSATLRGPAGRLFSRAGSAGHTPLRWVPDRVLTMSVTLRNRS